MNYPEKFVEWYNWVKTIREMPPIEVAYQQSLDEESSEQDKKQSDRIKEKDKNEQRYREDMMNNSSGI